YEFLAFCFFPSLTILDFKLFFYFFSSIILLNERGVSLYGALCYSLSIKFICLVFSATSSGFTFILATPLSIAAFATLFATAGATQNQMEQESHNQHSVHFL